MRTRIVHITTGLATGGAEHTLYKLLCSMNRGRFEHTVVSLGDGDWPLIKRIEALGVPVHRCGMRPQVPNPATAFRFLNLVRGLRPHLLQGWMYHGNLAAQIAAHTLRVSAPVIWNICNGAMRREKFTTSAAVWLGGRLSRRPARIVTDSLASAEAHQQKLNYSDRQWEVIPNGYNLEQFQPSEAARESVRAELSLAPDALLIGLIGRYHPVKNHSGFLKTAALLRQRTPDAHFLLVGSGVGGNPVLMEQVRGLGLIGAVDLLGDRADMPRISAALDIAVSSSHSESFPNVVGEAMCSGVPCVVTDVGSSAHLVGDTGRVAPPDDPGALAEACYALVLLGREGRRALGAAARRRIAERFSIHSTAALYEQLCENVLEEHTQAR